MRATVVQEQDVETVSIRLCEGVDKDLEIIGIQVGQFQKEVFATCGCHGTIDVEPLKDVLDGADRLHATCRQPTATDSQQAKAALILTEDPHGSRIRGRNGRLQMGVALGLKGREPIRVFVCGWVVAL